MIWQRARGQGPQQECRCGSRGRTACNVAVALGSVRLAFSGSDVRVWLCVVRCLGEVKWYGAVCCVCVCVCVARTTHHMKRLGMAQSRGVASEFWTHTTKTRTASYFNRVPEAQKPCIVTKHFVRIRRWQTLGALFEKRLLRVRGREEWEEGGGI